MADPSRSPLQIDDADVQVAESSVPFVDGVSRNLNGASIDHEEQRQTSRATALIPKACMRLLDFDRARHFPIVFGAAFVLTLGTGSQIEAAAPKTESSNIQRELKPGQRTSSTSNAKAIEPDFSTLLIAPYFTPDGKTLVTKRVKPWAATTVQLWDVVTGEQRVAIEHLSESAMGDELMSRDGKLMIVGIPDGLALWNVETGTRQSHSPIEGRWPQLSLDGTLLMSVCGNSKKLWDTKTGTELAVITGDKLFKLSPDGKYAASYNLGEGIIEIWDVDNLLDAEK